MALSSCFSHSKIDHIGKKTIWNGAELCNKLIVRSRINLTKDWSFIRGSRVLVKQKVTRLASCRKANPVYASLLSGSQLASTAFTIGTTSVLPFYTLMILAPNSNLTKKSMQSNVPYAILGILYAYLLFLSWTPETVELIFASKYLLPELTSIGKMFSSEMTLASAWIHLLVIDLFAARFCLVSNPPPITLLSDSLTLRSIDTEILNEHKSLSCWRQTSSVRAKHVRT